MADIVISYAHKDYARAEQLVHALEECGWSVFWGHPTTTGKTWRQIFDEEFKEARCVIVLWSSASIKSDWVSAEAEEGRRRNILIPVLIENEAEQPTAFREMVPAADLSRWDGAAESSDFQAIVSGIEQIIGLREESSDAPPESDVTTLSVFVSYRREDSADVTGRICDHIENRFGKEAVYVDVDRIPLGVDFREHIEKAVEQCKVLLAVVGPRWGERSLDERDFVRIEIEAALKRNIPVIPILVGGASMPTIVDLPESMASFSYRNGTRIRPDPDFRADIERLIKGLDGHLRNS